jgi:hypothetical protein
MNDKKYSYKSEIEVPLNIIKEKIELAIPGVEVEDEAILGFSCALDHFLSLLAKKIHIDNNDEKKILIRDIKSSIEGEPKFSFLKKLIDK